MDQGGDNAVLFAELIGAAELYGTAGDRAALKAIAGCTGRLGLAAESCDAKVVKTIGGRLMVLAANADEAARAAVAMHAAADSYAAETTTRLGLGVGFHSGPVIRQGGDVFGDAVNLAARLVEQAGSGQVLLAAETGEALSPEYRRLMRELYPITMKGRSEEVTLCELVWRIDDPSTFLPFKAQKLRPTRLTLRYRAASLVLKAGPELVTIGRGDDCGLMVVNQEASRHHCTLQERNGHFVLVDSSTNGTYVTVKGEDEAQVARDQFVLRRRGWLSLGAPRGTAGDAVEFICE